MLIKKVLAYIVLLSLLLLGYSLSMPAYNNDTYKHALDDKAMQAMSKNEFEQFRGYYFSKVNELKTNKSHVMDFAFGLLVASVSLYCFTLSSKIRKYHNYKAVKTTKKGGIILMANFMWLMLLPGVYWHYLFRSGRGDYPWFADDVSIPLGTKVPFIIVGWVLMNIFVVVFSRKGKFPAQLFVKQPREYPKAIAWDAFWYSLIFLNTLFLGWLIIDGDHISIVVDLYLTYLLLSLRAGKINALRTDKTKQDGEAADNQIEINARPTT